jgi:hypothetical protein
LGKILNAGSWLLRIGFPVGLCVALVVHLMILVTRFALPAPLSDHWGTLGELLTAIDQGDALLPTLWAQANEHRLVVGRLADVITIRLFGGDLRVEN